MTIERPVELTLPTFLAATAYAGRGEPHRILATGPSFVPPRSHGTLDEDAAAELAGLGLLDGTELGERFSHTLRVLEQAHTEYFAHVRAGEHQYGVLVAALGRTTTLAAVSENDRILLEPARSDDPARTLVAYLPEHPPARFRTFSASLDEFADDDIVDRGRSRDADDLERMLTPPFGGTGYLHVARRADGGPRVQAGQAITYTDTTMGRVGYDITGERRNPHVVAFPGDPDGFTERLARLRRTLD